MVKNFNINSTHCSSLTTLETVVNSVKRAVEMVSMQKGVDTT